jgi:voltage-gated potassium channel
MVVAEPKSGVVAGHASSLRRLVYDILDDATTHLHGLALHRGLILLVLVSVTASVLETVPSLQGPLKPFFLGIEFVAGLVFSVEYFARLWAAPEHPPWREQPPWQARLRHAVSPDGLIDLAAILPLYLSVFFGADLGAFLLLRLLRFLKLARYSPSARCIIDAVSRERSALGACAVVVAALILLSATLMHVVEGGVQPEKLGTIPDAMYWAVVTLATVGYGDVVPITPTGKLIASVTGLMGLISFAIPVGIVATAFAEAIQRREFVVTWSMVARVPIFAEMAAAEIAEVMRFLRSQTVQKNELVVRQGEMAHSMYFIASGEVQIELPDGIVPLGEGDFFGELAILQGTHRSATVRALSTVRLLVLDAADFRSILLHYPALARRVEHARAKRDAVAFPDKSGDTTRGELPGKRARRAARQPG